MEKVKPFIPLASLVILALILREPLKMFAEKWTTDPRPPTAMEIKAAWESETARLAAEQNEHKAAQDQLASLTGSAQSSSSASNTSRAARGTSATPTPAFVYQPGTTPDFLPWPSGRPPLVAPSDFDGKLRNVSLRAQDYFPGLPAGVVYDYHIVVEPGRQIKMYANGYTNADNVFMLPMHTDNSKGKLPGCRIMDIVSEDETPVNVTLEFTRSK
jgi:hypothetical protein